MNARQPKDCPAQISSTCHAIDIRISNRHKRRWERDKQREVTNKEVELNEA